LRYPDNSMSDKEWESATANARVFVAQRLEDSRDFAHANWREENSDEVNDIFNDYMSYVKDALEKGDSRPYHRRIQKKIIEHNGRELPFWSNSIFTTLERSLLYHVQRELDAIKAFIELENPNGKIIIEHVSEEKIRAAKERFITNLCVWSR
jgi:hypothetical protein